MIWRQWWAAVLITAAAFSSVFGADQKNERSRFSNPLGVFKPVAWAIQSAGIALAEATNKGKPFEEFTRPADIKDKRSLEEKAALFEGEINQDFLRDSGRLFWSLIPNDLGDMAIWQGYYTAFRAFKYATTKSSFDLAALNKSLDGQALLMAGFGKAYLVRGVDPVGGDSRRHRFRREGSPYVWVEDASGSSLSGTVFGLYCAWRYGDSEVRQRARELIIKLGKNFVDSNYRLLNFDGRPTRYGNHDFNGWALAVPKLLTTAALLSLAETVGGGDLFTREKESFKKNQRVLKAAARGEVHFLWYAKEYHQHLAFMNYFVLMGVERDAELRDLWYRNLQELMGKFRKEGNPFFALIASHYLPIPSADIEKSIQTLQEFNFPKIQAPVVNSLDPTIPKVGRWSRQPLPAWRRPNTDVIWQRDPYELDNFDGTRFRYTGIDFLIAYWMGRHLGAIDQKL